MTDKNQEASSITIPTWFLKLAGGFSVLATSVIVPWCWWVTQSINACPTRDEMNAVIVENQEKFTKVIDRNTEAINGLKIQTARLEVYLTKEAGN